MASAAWSSSNPGKFSRFFTLSFSSVGLELFVRSERYVRRYGLCRRFHGRHLYLSSARLPIKRLHTKRSYSIGCDAKYIGVR